jgi:hypothetical protein
VSAADYYAQRTAALEARLLEVLSEHDDELDESIPVDARQGIRSNAGVVGSVLAVVGRGLATLLGLDAQHDLGARERAATVEPHERVITMADDYIPKRLHELGEVTPAEGRAITSHGLSEARIVVDGETLTFAQSMTVRVALDSFLAQLADGDLAQLGEPLRSRYEARAREVVTLIHRSAANVEAEPEHRPLCKCGRVLSAPHRLGLCSVCAHELP